MNEHEHDITMKALTDATGGIQEVLTSGDINWSADEQEALRRATDILAGARRGLLMVEG